VTLAPASGCGINLRHTRTSMELLTEIAWPHKTQNRAEVGDLFMSLIHTCELNGANPFDYLTELQKHAEELAKNLAVWMPWIPSDPSSGPGENPA